MLEPEWLGCKNYEKQMKMSDSTGHNRKNYPFLVAILDVFFTV
jgi:hypothetical protein